MDVWVTPRPRLTTRSLTSIYLQRVICIQRIANNCNYPAIFRFEWKSGRNNRYMLRAVSKQLCTIHAGFDFGHNLVTPLSCTGPFSRASVGLKVGLKTTARAPPILSTHTSTTNVQPVRSCKSVALDLSTTHARSLNHTCIPMQLSLEILFVFPRTHGSVPIFYSLQ